MFNRRFWKFKCLLCLAGLSACCYNYLHVEEEAPDPDESLPPAREPSMPARPSASPTSLPAAAPAAAPPSYVSPSQSA